MFRPIAAAAVLLATLFLATSTADAAPTPEQREQLKTLKIDIVKTSNYLKRGMVNESVELIRSVQQRMEAFDGADDAEVANELKQLTQSLAVTHGLLELEGYTLKPLPGMVNTSDVGAMPAMDAPGTTPPAGAPAPLPDTFPTANISFTKHVAPILIARCGNCHVTGARGEFSAATFEALMKGPPEGVVVFPGDDVGSRLIETIESGDMPRGGQKVRAPELAALKTWIKEGAKFDGTNPQAPISQAAGTPAPNPAEMMRLEVVNATGNEKTSFSMDVAGVFSSRCASCHTGQTRGVTSGWTTSPH